MVRRIAISAKPDQAIIVRSFALPYLTLTDGTVEAIKWLALVLMTFDHVNKYLLHDTVTLIFDAGRLSAPLFAFVLAYNLARPETLTRGVYPRVLKRLAIFGAVATVPFIALGGLVAGWWPLNIMGMLLVAVCMMYLVDQGGFVRWVLALLLFLVGGVLVEYWWPALLMCLAAWFYCKKPSWLALIMWVFSTTLLFLINHNLWALAAFPVIFAAPHIHLNMPRLRHVFYAYYPAHLAVLWALSRL